MVYAEITWIFVCAILCAVLVGFGLGANVSGRPRLHRTCCAALPGLPCARQCRGYA